MDEKKYPIYRFWVEFEDRDQNVSSSKMLGKFPSREEAFVLLDEFINTNLDSERQGRDGVYTIRSLDLEVVGAGWKFLREETWCCNWFNHYTYNIHLSDEELLESFQAYVERQRPYICEDLGSYDEYKRRVPEDKRICLMGAQDRWRWKEPCRCEHCQERGIVMIDH